MFFFKNLNKTKVDGCVTRLQETLEKFQVCKRHSRPPMSLKFSLQLSNDLHAGEDLHRIQARLEDIFGLTKRMVQQMHSVDSKVDEIREMMKHATEGHKAGSFLLMGGMPEKPRHYHRHDSIVADVACLLTSEDKARVCILGPGGMGKTSVALAVMESEAVGNKFRYENRFWVPCIGATSPSLLLQILYRSLRITRDTGNSLADICSELKASTDPRVILLDNFETPWNPRQGHQRDVEAILRSLSTLPHISVLVTMRSNFPPSDEIEWDYKILGPTDEEASRMIYTDIDPSAAAHPALGDLLCAVGHMPYAVTLMATLGKKSKSSPDELLTIWSTSGTDMQEAMNHCISLSVNSKLVADNPEAMELLATLSMLPEGANRRDLDWWAPTLKNRAGAIATLSDAALVVDRDLGGSRGTMISVIPVVQSYMQRNDRISKTVRKNVQDACLKFVWDHRSTVNAPTYKDDAAALDSEATNIQTVLMEAAVELATSPDPSVLDEEQSARADTLLDVLLVFAWYHRWSKANADVAECIVTVARVTKKECMLAEGLFCLASTVAATVQNADACKHFKEARKYFRNQRNWERSGHCALELANNYQYMSEPPNIVEKFVLEAQNDFKEDGRVYAVSLGLLTLGYFCWYRGDYDKGLEHLEAARAAFEGINRTIDVATCLLEASRCHAGNACYLEALDAIKGAHRGYEGIGVTRQVCEALVLMARYLKMLDRGGEALEILRCCLEQCQPLGCPLLIAQTLEEFGTIYAQKGDHPAARAAYEGAQEQFESISVTSLGREGEARCRHNILQLLQLEQNPADNIIQLQHATRY